MKPIAVVILSLCICLTVAFGADPLQQKQGRATKNRDNDRARPADKPTVEYLNPKGGSNRPFSEAVRVGDFLILSGKLGTDSSGKLVAGGIKAETGQTLENIRAALEAYGSSLDQVVKCTVMLADIKEREEMNEVYTTFFKKDRMPTRSALGVSGLALGARVEIECWAVIKKAE